MGEKENWLRANQSLLNDGTHLIRNELSTCEIEKQFDQASNQSHVVRVVNLNVL